MTDPAIRVMIVEDDEALRRFLRSSLEAHKYLVIEADSGAAALDRAAGERPDIVLLDLGLPDLDGLEVIAGIRAWSQMPIVVVSSRNAEREKITALDRGADDYVTKPFSTGELLARLRAAARHGMRSQGVEPVYRSGALSVDLVRRTVTKAGLPVRLSRKEYELLRYLVVNADRLVMHEPTLTHVWGVAQAKETQYLRVFIGRIRQKIEDNPARPSLIVTEPGVGYRLRTLPEA